MPRPLRSRLEAPKPAPIARLMPLSTQFPHTGRLLSSQPEHSFAGLSPVSHTGPVACRRRRPSGRGRGVHSGDRRKRGSRWPTFLKIADPRNGGPPLKSLGWTGKPAPVPYVQAKPQALGRPLGHGGRPHSPIAGRRTHVPLHSNRLAVDGEGCALVRDRADGFPTPSAQAAAARPGWSRRSWRSRAAVPRPPSRRVAARRSPAPGARPAPTRHRPMGRSPCGIRRAQHADPAGNAAAPRDHGHRQPVAVRRLLQLLRRMAPPVRPVPVGPLALQPARECRQRLLGARRVGR
jgi:hypothetical protein